MSELSKALFGAYRRPSVARRLARVVAGGRATWESVDHVYPSARAICSLVSRNISYRAEPPGRDRWQTPRETWERGHGDCEDFAVLVRHLCRRSDIVCLMRIYFIRAGRAAAHAVAMGPIERDGSWWVSSSGAYAQTDDPESHIAFTLGWSTATLGHLDVSAALLDKMLGHDANQDRIAVGLSSIGACGGHTNRCARCDFPIPPGRTRCADCEKEDPR